MNRVKRDKVDQHLHSALRLIDHLYGIIFDATHDSSGCIIDRESFLIAGCVKKQLIKDIVSDMEEIPYDGKDIRSDCCPVCGSMDWSIDHKKAPRGDCGDQNGAGGD